MTPFVPPLSKPIKYARATSQSSTISGCGIDKSETSKVGFVFQVRRIISSFYMYFKIIYIDHIYTILINQISCQYNFSVRI